MRKITFTLLFLLIGTLAFSQVLWESTRQGMSVEQVQNLYPSAVTPDNPNTSVEAIELLRDTATLNLGRNYNFEVSFFFENNGLDHVLLTLIPNPPATRNTYDRIARYLTRRLRSEYYSLSDVYNNDKGDSSITWSKGRSLIMLFWVNSELKLLYGRFDY